MNTILIVSILYVAFTSMVLLTFRAMRDRNIMEEEYYTEEKHTQEMGMLLLQD